MFDAIKSIFSSNKNNQSNISKKEIKLQKKYGLNSGGVVRDDKQIECGWAITKGRRFHNEDNVYCKVHPIPDDQKEGSTSQIACLAIFDGHGGANASNYVRDHLFQNLLKHKSFHTDLFKAFEDAFVQTDSDYILQDEIHRNDDGCTATAAIIMGHRLVVAHVGDSRAVIGHDGTATALTKDHKPNRPDERKRIEEIGGTVVHAGTWRVGGVLAVSRSFGNRMMKQFIVALPEIREDSLDTASQCVILASDGVWDVVSNEEATKLVLQYEDAESAARGLAAMAYDRGSHDNISCVVCLLNFTDDDSKMARDMHAIPEDETGGDSHTTATGGIATINAIGRNSTVSSSGSGVGSPRGVSRRKPPLVTADTAKSLKIFHDRSNNNSNNDIDTTSG